jgi:endonuclease/exonuclease/phosphatase family metal-dependent hydrolase
MKKLLTLNIEGDNHLARVKPFIAEENPDIICLQEVFREDISVLVGTEYQVEFLPLCLKVRRSGELAQRGVAICTRTPAWKVVREYYHQPTTTCVPADDTDETTKRRTYWYGVIGVTIEDGGHDMNICSTHFTWTSNGLSTPAQAEDMKKLLTLTAEFAPHIICGDFNMPRRQNTLYPLVATHYTDHIPNVYETTMYVPLHRVKDDPVESKRINQFVVDYIFSTPGAYEVLGVELRGNISDHYGVVAHVNRSAP